MERDYSQASTKQKLQIAQANIEASDAQLAHLRALHEKWSAYVAVLERIQELEVQTGIAKPEGKEARNA